MVIKVPEIALKYDLTDNELVFTALMLFLSRTEGKHTTFNFFSEDVKIILGHMKPSRQKTRGAMSQDEYGTGEAQWRLAELRKIFDIGIKNFQTWSVHFKSTIPDEYLTPQRYIKATETVITAPGAIKTYCYIVGMVSNGSIVSDKKPRLYDTFDKKKKTIHPFFFKDFSLL